MLLLILMVSEGLISLMSTGLLLFVTASVLIQLKEIGTLLAETLNFLLLGILKELSIPLPMSIRTLILLKNRLSSQLMVYLALLKDRV